MMKRLVTGVVVAAMLAASQAGATANGVVTPADRATPAAQGTPDQMMGGEFGAGWLIVTLGVVLIVAAVIDGNNRHDRPSSP